MKKEHGNPTRMEGQGSSQKVKAIRNEVQGQVKNQKKEKFNYPHYQLKRVFVPKHVLLIVLSL